MRYERRTEWIVASPTLPHLLNGTPGPAFIFRCAAPHPHPHPRPSLARPRTSWGGGTTRYSDPPDAPRYSTLNVLRITRGPGNGSGSGIPDALTR